MAPSPPVWVALPRTDGHWSSLAHSIFTGDAVSDRGMTCTNYQLNIFAPSSITNQVWTGKKEINKHSNIYLNFFIAIY